MDQLVAQMRIVSALAAFSASIICGCSVHPLPDQVGDRLETHLIVQKIRCEAQDAVNAVFMGKAASPNIYRGDLKKFKAVTDAERLAIIKRKQAYDEFSKKISKAQKNRKDLTKTGVVLAQERVDLQIRERELLLRLERFNAALQENDITEDALKELNNDYASIERDWKLFRADERNFRQRVINFDRRLKDDDRWIKSLQGIRKSQYGDVLTYLGHQLTMQIKFSITEKNTGKVDGSVKLPIPLGLVTIDPSIGDERERLGERTVKLAVDFRDLIDGEREDASPCQKSPLSAEQPVRYPIVGLVGLAEVIEQYLQILTQAKGILSSDVKAGSEAYTHKIQFKTTVSGGLKPKIIITQLTGQSFTGNLDLSGSRTDTHEVLVGLYDEKEKDDTEDDKITKVQIVKGPRY